MTGARTVRRFRRVLAGSRGIMWTALGALTLAASCTSADTAADAAADAERPAVRGWPVAPDATVRLYVPAGDVSVHTWDRDSVELRGTLRANASLFGGGTRTHVKVGVEAHSQADGTLPHASLEVYVPRRARLWVKMIDGALSVSGTLVEVEAYTVSGRVDVRDVQGSTTIESIDAPVQLSQATGDVRIRGSRAAIALDQVDALVSIATVSGPVVLRASPVEGRIETVGGAITVNGVRAGGVLTLQSHAGDITLALPAAMQPRLALWSRGDAVPEGAVRGGEAREGAGRASQVTGDVRNGTIEARSFKGRVQVQRLP